MAYSSADVSCELAQMLASAGRVEFAWMFLVVLVTFDKPEVKGNNEQIDILFNLEQNVSL